MKAQPTPTPWQAETDLRATNEFQVCIRGPQGHDMPTIALLVQPGHGLNPGETPLARAQANGELVCLAVNNHDALVTALRSILVHEGHPVTVAGKGACISFAVPVAVVEQARTTAKGGD